MQITKEKEPERASTPGLDAPIQNLLQRNHEVESVLETELLDLSRTPTDISGDELVSSSQKEELTQQ